jgi:hypothetical protein
MEMPRRHRFKWTINETLQLHREYELLNMDIEEIALKHERTVNGIIQKIEEILNDSDEDLEEEDEDEDFVDEDDADIVEDSSTLCITEKKEPMDEGSPQKTIHAYEYFKRSVFGWFSPAKI